MISTSQIQAVQDHLGELARRIHSKDCPRVKRWLRTAKLERYKDEDSALRAAEKSLKPQAVDWQKVIEFLKAILPFILPLLIKRKGMKP